jgi:hypothetical protein
MSYAQPDFPDSPRQGSDKTTAPGVCLIIVGALNLLIGLGCILFSTALSHMSEKELRDQMIAQGREQALKDMEKNGLSLAQFKNTMSTSLSIVGGLSALGALIVIYGGWCLCTMKHYGVAVIASIWAMVPGLSMCFCLSQIFGLWSLIVLMSQDVRAAFR